MVYTVGLVMSNNSLSLYIIYNICREIQVYIGGKLLKIYIAVFL